MILYEQYPKIVNFKTNTSNTRSLEYLKVTPSESTIAQFQIMNFLWIVFINTKSASIIGRKLVFNMQWFTTVANIRVTAQFNPTTKRMSVVWEDWVPLHTPCVYNGIDNSYVFLLYLLYIHLYAYCEMKTNKLELRKVTQGNAASHWLLHKVSARSMSRGALQLI